MTIADLARKIAKLTDEDKLDWKERAGGYTVANDNYSITIIRQVNSLNIPQRTDLIFVSGSDTTKTPSTFNLCDYDYRTITEAIIRVGIRRKNAIKIGQLNHAERVIQGLVKQ